MIIKGTEKREVAIDVCPLEIIGLLGKKYGIELEPQRDEYQKIEQEEKEDGPHYYIREYNDFSMHGSPYYKMVSEKEISKEQYNVIQAVKYLHTYEASSDKRK